MCLCCNNLCAFVDHVLCYPDLEVRNRRLPLRLNLIVPYSRLLYSVSWFRTNGSGLPSPETSVLNQPTLRNNPEDGRILNWRCLWWGVMLLFNLRLHQFICQRICQQIRDLCAIKQPCPTAELKRTPCIICVGDEYSESLHLLIVRRDYNSSRFHTFIQPHGKMSPATWQKHKMRSQCDIWFLHSINWALMVFLNWWTSINYLSNIDSHCGISNDPHHGKSN